MNRWGLIVSISLWSLSISCCPKGFDLTSKAKQQHTHVHTLIQLQKQRTTAQIWKERASGSKYFSSPLSPLNKNKSADFSASFRSDCGTMDLSVGGNVMSFKKMCITHTPKTWLDRLTLDLRKMVSWFAFQRKTVLKISMGVVCRYNSWMDWFQKEIIFYS